MPKTQMVVLETTPETLMDCCLTLANIVVQCKKNPKLLAIVPDEGVEDVVISILRVLIERDNKQQSGVDPAQEKIDEEKLEQSVNAAMEALLKAADK